jgi:membrane protein YdbS with pleckstrin-like domain
MPVNVRFGRLRYDRISEHSCPMEFRSRSNQDSFLPNSLQLLIDVNRHVIYFLRHAKPTIVRVALPAVMLVQAPVKILVRQPFIARGLASFGGFLVVVAPHLLTVLNAE